MNGADAVGAMTRIRYSAQRGERALNEASAIVEQAPEPGAKIGRDELGEGAARDQYRNDRRQCAFCAVVDEDAVQVGHRRVERGRAEEHPGQADEVEGDRPVKDAHDPPLAEALKQRAAAIGVVEDERGAVHRAPDQKRPVGAVPQAAEHHRQHQIARGKQLAAAVAAERDVKVVAQPIGQRHVPAPPKVADAEGAIGLVEVLRETIAEQRRDADGDIGVGREVGVNLHRIGIDRHNQVEARELRRVGEHRIDQAHRKVVGDHHLLEQAAENEQHVLAEREVAGAAGRGQLRQEFVGAHDGAGDQMRKEADVEQDVDGRPRRLQTAAKDINYVGDGVKGEERDRDRQRHVDEVERQVDADARGSPSSPGR